MYNKVGQVLAGLRWPAAHPGALPLGTLHLAATREQAFKQRLRWGSPCWPGALPSHACWPRTVSQLLAARSLHAALLWPAAWVLPDMPQALRGSAQGMPMLVLQSLLQRHLHAMAISHERHERLRRQAPRRSPYAQGKATLVLESPFCGTHMPWLVQIPPDHKARRTHRTQTVAMRAGHVEAGAGEPLLQRQDAVAAVHERHPRYALLSSP